MANAILLPGLVVVNKRAGVAHAARKDRHPCRDDPSAATSAAQRAVG
jgi:hypothetical protein